MIKKLRRMFGRTDTHMAEVLSSVKVTLVLRVLGAGVSLLFNIAVARLLGAEGAGLYFMAFSVMMLSGFVGRLGLEVSLLRFIARGAAETNWLAVHGVFRLAIRWAMAVTALIAVFWVITAQWTGTLFFGEPAVAGPLRIMAFAIITQSMTVLLSSALLGVKKVRQSVMVSNVLPPAISLLVIWPYHQMFGIDSSALAYLTGSLTASAIAFWMWQRATAETPSDGAWFNPRELWSSARPLWAASVITRGLMPWGPLFFLAAFASAKDVGIFGTASRVALLLSFALKSVNSVLAPKFTELHKKGKIEQMASVARRFSGLLALVTIPAFIFVALCGDFVMGLFGEDFRNGGQLLAILTFGQLFSTISGSVLIILSMTGNENDVRTTTIAAAVVVLLGSVALIPPFGMLGAAWTVTLSMIVSNLVGTYKIWRRLGVIILPIPGIGKKRR